MNKRVRVITTEEEKGVNVMRVKSKRRHQRKGGDENGELIDGSLKAHREQSDIPRLGSRLSQGEASPI